MDMSILGHWLTNMMSTFPVECVCRVIEHLQSVGSIQICEV